MKLKFDAKISAVTAIFSVAAFPVHSIMIIAFY